MPPDEPKVVAYLPYTEGDHRFLRNNGIHVDRFFVLPEIVDFAAPHQFEMFARYGEESFVVPAAQMIPICLDKNYDGLFLVQFFSDQSVVIAEAPATTHEVLQELQPLLEGGCNPILFTLMRDPYDAKMDQLAQRIALERTVGFRKDDDAVLAQVIAEGGSNVR